MPTYKPTKIEVRQGDDPTPAHIMEQAIVEISEGVKKLSNTRLKKETIVALIHDTTKVSKRVITVVLNSLDQLEKLYLKPKP